MTQQKYEYNTIEEALEELRAGHMIIVSDDPDRENEGDLICAAQFCTTENMNFMASHGKGLICMPVSREYARKLSLPPMVAQNTDNHETAFTVSIDHVDTTTGISAVERAYTARKLVDENPRPEDFRRPGHMFPLIAKKGGVLTRNGHTEATVDLMRLAGLEQAGLCCEIMADDGTMLRTPGLWKMAKEYGLKFITIKDLQNYCRRHDKHVVREAEAKMPTKKTNVTPSEMPIRRTLPSPNPMAEIKEITTIACSAVCSLNKLINQSIVLLSEFGRKGRG